MAPGASTRRGDSGALVRTSPRTATGAPLKSSTANQRRAHAEGVVDQHLPHDQRPTAGGGVTELAGPALLAAGGRVLARGIPAAAFEVGTRERTTLIEFDSVDVAVAAYKSPAYQAALKVLGDAAERDVRIIEADASSGT